MHAYTNNNNGYADIDIDDLTQSLRQTSANAMQFKKDIRNLRSVKKKKKIKIKRKANRMPTKELDWSSINIEVLNELNKVRASPLSLIPRLEFIAKNMKKNVYYPPHSKIGIIYKEGIQVITESIHFLKKQERRKALTLSNGLTDAAMVHVGDQSASGDVGHIGLDGMKASHRINNVHKDQKWKVGVAENIMYGRENGRDIVCSLVVDDGVKSRGHRSNMFSDEWRIVGIASGSHPKYRTMCVIDFAVGYGH